MKKIILEYRLYSATGHWNFGAVGGTSNNVEGVRNFFCAIMVPQSPIGLISAEIGALCRILGHATIHASSYCLTNQLTLKSWDCYQFNQPVSFQVAIFYCVYHAISIPQSVNRITCRHLFRTCRNAIMEIQCLEYSY